MSISAEQLAADEAFILGDLPMHQTVSVKIRAGSNVNGVPAYSDTTVTGVAANIEQISASEEFDPSGTKLRTVNGFSVILKNATGLSALKAKDYIVWGSRTLQITGIMRGTSFHRLTCEERE